MESSVLAVTLISALNPVRLGLTLLMISRPRPVQNLLAFWAGCLTGAVLAVAVPLTLLHSTRMFDSFGQGQASPTVRHVQVGMGVLALSMAALVAVLQMRRHRKGSTASTLVVDSNTPAAISRLLDRAQDAATQDGPSFQRLLHRAHIAWNKGSLWVAYLIGLGFGGPQPDLALFVVAITVASAAGIGTQLITATAFVVGTFAVVEIIIVSYLVTPAKTHEVLQLLHCWASAHRRKILAAIFAVVGVALVTQGLSS
jgi:hypothetical protein